MFTAREKRSDLDQGKGYESSGVYDRPRALFEHNRKGDGLGHGAPMFQLLHSCLSPQFSSHGPHHLVSST
jgi:hypothetical protein